MPEPVLTFLHRQVWRRLPHRTRRAALLRATSWGAPRITPSAKAKAPVIVAGLLSQASGLGAASRACHDALKARGVEVYAVDLTSALMHDRNYTGFVFADGRGLIGEGTILLHVSGPMVPLAMFRLGRRLVADKRVIAHWFWELPRMPDDWRLGVPFVHAICVNTSFVADAVRPIADGRRVHIVPYPLPRPAGFPLPSARAPAGTAGRPFTALGVFNVASNFARKNPCASIAAFRRAFGDDASVRLIVQYSNAFAWPEAVSRLARAAEDADNIVLRGEVLSAAGMDALYDEADVVLSLHRAEGLGLVVAEAMLRGLPVVATAWSGNADFLTRETGMPIGYDLVPVDDPQGNYNLADCLWAEPDVEQAAAALRTLRADPTLRARLGAAAARQVSRVFDPARYAEAVMLTFFPPETAGRSGAGAQDDQDGQCGSTGIGSGKAL
jgi:glycosyltransferase involved in cell wall biosynthesis